MVEEQKIVLTKPDKIEALSRVSYDGPKDAKSIDLANLGEDSKPVYIAMDLEPNKEPKLI